MYTSYTSIIEIVKKFKSILLEPYTVSYIYVR